ncbi:hypothetical protein L0B53_06205 [Vibrio sp. SS-MA-C1-2]|uniref:hypothetical protein n=1 Tax=Vibrio sp. SS-MA-C1-2 TaxID=2908646 RepID=UPI001F39CE16|nr:hypothetical protein [Vibrio sp. SS-MA-C1-2]UJF19167.1 hypothetical protein L0B53_06205 [Vibrio sp. SS-MA-C1-2]
MILDELIILAAGAYFLYRCWNRDVYQSAAFILLLEDGMTMKEAQARSKACRGENDPKVMKFIWSHKEGKTDILKCAKKQGLKTALW